MPIDVKSRMKNILESQQMRSLNKSESRLNKCEEIEYKCIKCRDMTFIIDDGVAIPCECRALRVAEEILNKSGIGKEFRNKRFDNFDFSRSMAIANELMDTGILIIYGLLLAYRVVLGYCLILMRRLGVGLLR